MDAAGLFVDRVVASDGSHRSIMWTGVPDHHTGLFDIVGRDVTEQRRVEEALRQSRKMAARARAAESRR